MVKTSSPGLFLLKSRSMSSFSPEFLKCVFCFLLQIIPHALKKFFITFRNLQILVEAAFLPSWLLYWSEGQILKCIPLNKLHATWDTKEFNSGLDNRLSWAVDKSWFLSFALKTLHKYMEQNSMLLLPRFLCSDVVCLKIRYALQDLTTKCNMMFGKSEPLSQKTVYLFSPCLLNKVLQEKIASLWLAWLQFCWIIWWT